MKEFVEKLIERLEAQPTEQFVGINGNHGLVSTVIDCCVECVNQLAEEYTPSKSSSLAEQIAELKEEFASDINVGSKAEQIADDLSKVLKEAKSMGCKEVKAFYHIPLENVEAVIKALKAYNGKYDSELIEKINFAIEASNTNDNYMTGLRNGMRYCLALIDGKEPEFEECNQDSTKKNQGWILCSEKLPEKRSWYLALFKESSTGFVGLPYIADYLMGNHTSWTTKDGWIIKDCTNIDNVNEYFKDLECVAWQPLPNPCSFTHEKELVEFCKPEEKPKFSNEELDRIMDKILDTTQEETNFYVERFNRVL